MKIGQAKETKVNIEYRGESSTFSTDARLWQVAQSLANDIEAKNIMLWRENRDKFERVRGAENLALGTEINFHQESSTLFIYNWVRLRGIRIVTSTQ